MASLIINISEEILSIKSEMQNISKQFKRKIQLIREDKLLFSQIETKSNNLKLLGEELVNHMHLMTGQIDHFHQKLITIKTVFLTKLIDHKGKVKTCFFNI